MRYSPAGSGDGPPDCGRRIREDRDELCPTVCVNDRAVTSVDDLHRLLTDFRGQLALTLTRVREARRLAVDVRPALSH